MIRLDDERGKIRSLPRYKQPVDFSGLRYGRITPTDIDGLIEYRNKVFVLYELKLRDAPIEHGQKIALKNIIDSMIKGGSYAVLFKCSHEVDDTSQQIDLSNSIVTEFYLGDMWRKPKSIMTAREATDEYFRWLKRKFDVQTPLDENSK